MFHIDTRTYIYIFRIIVAAVFFVVFFLSENLPVKAQPQIGGQYSFAFLNLPNSARAAALGTYQPASLPNDPDIALGWLNPALLNPQMHRQISAQYAWLPANIGHANFMAAHNYDSTTTLALGFQSVNYGDIPLTDDAGNTLGNFKAGDHAIYFGGGHSLGPFSIGVMTKFAFGNIESYKANAFAFDLGGVWQGKDNWVVGLVAKNMGAQLKNYYDSNEPLPFDLQLGVSKKLTYLPLRISGIAHHLHRWNLRYNDPALKPVNIFDTDTNQTEKAYFFDKLTRHLAFSAELTIAKVLRLQASYNHLKRREMRINNIGSMAVFSLGGGIHTNKFFFQYVYTLYSAAQTANTIGLQVNLNNWLIKKTPTPKDINNTPAH